MIPIGISTDFVNLPEAHAMGYDFMEVPLDDLAALSDGSFEEFAEYCGGNAVRVTAVNHILPDDLPIVGPEVHAAALHDYLKRAFGRCRRLNVRVVTMDAAVSRCVPAGFDHLMAWRQLGNFLRLAQGHARDCGLVIAVEPLRKTDCNLLNLVSEATLMAGLLQLNNVGVSANTGSMAMAAEPLSVLAQAGATLCHVHVENALSRRMPREADGEDYRKLMRTLRQIRYLGGICVCGRTSGDFPSEARAALICLRQAMRAS